MNAMQIQDSQKPTPSASEEALEAEFLMLLVAWRRRQIARRNHR